MSQDVRDAALQVIDNLAAEIQAQGDRTPVNVLDWTGKATYVLLHSTFFRF